MKNSTDRIGKKYGFLTVTGLVQKECSGVRRAYYECVCDCGNHITVRADRMTRGGTPSCGCLTNKLKSNSNKGKVGNPRYGDSRERLHNIWYLIKYRCENPESPAYHNYGGRGISMCKEWNDGDDGYFAFKQWALSNGYSPELSIDRIDNDGDYSPLNCRWVNKYAQANNKRNNVLYEINGVSKTIPDWCRDYNMPWKTVWSRVHRQGWDIRTALTKPIRTATTHK